MALYEIKSDSINPIETTRFDMAGLRERADLQRLLKKQMEVVLNDVLIIAEEFGEWEDSRRRIDLLAIDKEANLVVIELKRTEDGGHMELQAVRYAAMVSTLTFESVVDVYQRFLQSGGRGSLDPEQGILDFLGWKDRGEDEFARDVKIVLISSNFSKELTGAVLWLNKRDLDIRCIRLVPYNDNGRTLIDVQQIIPLPEAEEYQVKIKKKEQEDREERASHALLRRFWETLLAAGEDRNPLHSKMSAGPRSFVGASAGIRGFTYYYIANRFDRRVELYIDRGEAEYNKRLFEQIKNYKDEIEERFGEELSWEGLFGKRACRIAYHLPGNEFRGDESAWPEMHQAMIDGMIRLEIAVGPVLPRLNL